MAQQIETLVLVQLLVAVVIVYDALHRRKWMSNTQTFLFVVLSFLLPVAGPLIYLITVYYVERKMQEAEAAEEARKMVETLKHSVGSEKKECSSCGSRFDTSRGLRVHRSKEHADEINEEKESGEPSEEREFTCDECGRGFKSERGLHIHQSMKHE